MERTTNMKRHAQIYVKGEHVYLVNGLLTIKKYNMRDRYFGIKLIAYACDHNMSIDNLMDFHFPIIKVGINEHIPD